MYAYLFGPSFKEPFSAKELKSTLRNTEGERESPDTLARKYASLTFRY